MKGILQMAFCAVLATSTAVWAGDVALRLVDESGSSYGFYVPGTLTLEVRAIVTPTASAGGLALFGFDFEAPPEVPLASNQFTTTLTSFVKNEGLTNPGGFGGTLSGNTLLQIGGGQNSIGYTGTAPSYPTGLVVTGIGLVEVTIAKIVLDTSAAYGELEFEISNAFANLIDPASQPSAPPYTVSAANMLAGSPRYTAFTGPPPLYMNDDVKSWKVHGSVCGKLARAIPLTPQTLAPIETRAGSVTELTFSFTQPLEPGTFPQTAITICGHVNTPPPPATVSLDASMTEATLTWAANAIPNGFQQASQHDHYTVVVADTVMSENGAFLEGDRDFDFVASFGNVRADNLGNWRAVNSLDRTLLAQNYTDSPTAEQAVTFDIRIDGGNACRINSLDRTQLGQSYTPSAAQWLIQAPPPCARP